MKFAKILLCFILSLQVGFPASALAVESRNRSETPSCDVAYRVQTGTFRQHDKKLDLVQTNRNSNSAGIVRWNDEDWSLSRKTNNGPEDFHGKGSQLLSDFGKRTAETELVLDPLRPTLFARYAQEPHRFDDMTDEEMQALADWIFPPQTLLFLSVATLTFFLLYNTVGQE